MLLFLIISCVLTCGTAVFFSKEISNKLKHLLVILDEQKNKLNTKRKTNYISALKN